MKAWFSLNHRFFVDSDDYPVKIGIHWHCHAKPVKKFKSWRGFTIDLYFFKYWISFIIVDDYEAHQARMNYKRDPDYLKKMGERLKAIRERNEN